MAEEERKRLTKREAKSQKAKSHTELMDRKYAENINYSVQHSTIYSEDSNFTLDGNFKNKCPHIQYNIMDATSTFAAVAERERNADQKIAVLNFADYKKPGGLFLIGAFAQEEALCHESFLYNVLARFDNTYYAWNKKHLNKGLYLNRAIYSPDVTFICDDKEYTFDVITCAAPNYGAAKKYCHVTKDENEEVLKARIGFVLKIAKQQHVDTLVLGAWGCGVFKQEPEVTAKLFIECADTIFENTDISLVFAIPGKNTKNYEAFANVLALN